MDAPATQPQIDRIVRTPAGQLHVFLHGQDAPVADARLARAFPWSVPGGYYSVRTSDGKEVALLKSLDELDPASRVIALQELSQKVFNPRIRGVVDHQNDFGVSSITADTDRGRVTFQIRSRDDVRMLSATRALFRDADGNVYELVDLAALDAHSRNLLQEFF